MLPLRCRTCRPTRQWRPPAASESGAGAELVVGVVWRGNGREYAGDKIRSVPADLIAPLAKIPGVRLVSLMKEGNDEERAAAEAADIGATGWADFAEAAATYVNLDLVISVDTRGRSPCRRAGIAVVDRVAVGAGHAAAGPGTRGLAVVSDRSAVPPAEPGRVGAGVRPPRRRTGRAGATRAAPGPDRGQVVARRGAAFARPGTDGEESIGGSDGPPGGCRAAEER